MCCYGRKKGRKMNVAKTSAHENEANLALSFARLGLRSGILDTDIFGPSIPTLFNLTDADEPRLSSSKYPEKPSVPSSPRLNH